MLFLRQLLADFLFLFFPATCQACGESLVSGEHSICSGCLYDLPVTDFQLDPQNRVARIFWGRVPCSAAMAMMRFSKGSKVQRLIHSLKYRSQFALGLRLGNLLGERLRDVRPYQDCDLILPVPLHPRQERKRGYNQSAGIAKGIAQVTGMPVNSSALIRQTSTRSQTRKNRYERFENMLSVFAVAHPEAVQDKNILLVDDVVTTGATLEACAQLLLLAGAKQVTIAVLAFAE